MHGYYRVSVTVFCCTFNLGLCAACCCKGGPVLCCCSHKGASDELAPHRCSCPRCLWATGLLQGHSELRPELRDGLGPLVWPEGCRRRSGRPRSWESDSLFHVGLQGQSSRRTHPSPPEASATVRPRDPSPGRPVSAPPCPVAWSLSTQSLAAAQAAV